MNICPKCDDIYFGTAASHYCMGKPAEQPPEVCTTFGCKGACGWGGHADKPPEVPLTGPDLAEKYGFKPHTKPAEYAGWPVNDEVPTPEEVWLVARTSDGGPASGYHFLNYEDANNWIRRLNLRGVTPVRYVRAR